MNIERLRISAQSQAGLSQTFTSNARFNRPVLITLENSRTARKEFEEVHKIRVPESDSSNEHASFRFHDQISGANLIFFNSTP